MPIFCVTRRQTPDANPKICVSPDSNPRRQSVEYRWPWASGVGAGVGHVHFMFFVLISFAFCSQRKPSFRWNSTSSRMQHPYVIRLACSRLSKVNRVLCVQRRGCGSINFLYNNIGWKTSNPYKTGEKKDFFSI